MGAMASQITSLAIVNSTIYSDADQRKHQSSASLVFVLGIHRWPVNSPHKGPVTRKMFPFDDVIMKWRDSNWPMTFREKFLHWITKLDPNFFITVPVDNQSATHARPWAGTVIIKELDIFSPIVLCSSVYICIDQMALSKMAIEMLRDISAFRILISYQRLSKLASW